MDFQNIKDVWVISFFISAILMTATGILTKNFARPKYAQFIPCMICLFIMLLFGILILFPNGTGGYTQLEYFMIVSYAFWAFAFTVVGQAVIVQIKIIKKHYNKY